MHRETPTYSESSVLQVLRVSLHVMFAFLLILGAILALRQHFSLGLLLGTVLLGLLYMTGTVVENRYARGRLGGSVDANLPRDRPTLALTWLLTVTGLWVFLFMQNLSFAWVMFPLVFLYLHLLPLLPGLIGVCALTAFAIAHPVLTTQHHSVSAGTFIGPLMGSLLAVVISFAYRALYRDALTHQRTAEKLRATQAELILKEHESGRLEERERLAREIHDTLAQGLSSIVLISRNLETELATVQNPKAQEQIKVIHRVASDNLAEARRFIKDLSSPALTDSLLPALTRLCAETEEQEKARGRFLTCTLRIDGKDNKQTTSAEELTSAEQATLIRIAQGALANVRAHANAQHAVITLGLWDDATTLDIFDDGRGFDPEHISNTTEDSGYGLVSLTARAQAHSGQLNIESAPGQGTIVTARIPKNLVQKDQTSS